MSDRPHTRALKSRAAAARAVDSEAVSEALAWGEDLANLATVRGLSWGAIHAIKMPMFARTEPQVSSLCFEKVGNAAADEGACGGHGRVVALFVRGITARDGQ